MDRPPEKQAVYPSFNALSRVAMVWGIPLVALILVALASMVLAVIAAAIIGVGGIFFAVVGVPVLLFIKQISANDDQALRIAVLEFRCRLARRNAKLFGNTFTLSPMRYGRRKHVYKRHPK
ncbi:VirB3 family type IV secretion system protein [Streptococcus danieliae]|nr:VirB3 family type IV secretion system protein [Streptococcus danieliae]